MDNVTDNERLLNELVNALVGILKKNNCTPLESAWFLVTIQDVLLQAIEKVRVRKHV